MAPRCAIAPPSPACAIVLAGIFLLAGALAPALAQSTETPKATETSKTVERSAKGAANADIRVGVFINVKSDCSSGPLPTIRLVDKPGNGAVTVKSAKVKAQNYKTCLAVEVPAYVAFYKSKPDFSGLDTFSIEVKYPEGRQETQKFSVTIGGAVPVIPKNTKPGMPKGQEI